ncbi:flavohemoglobin expression-modulating QEGLA motif protein, partial [Actinomycetota bacterium]
MDEYRDTIRELSDRIVEAQGPIRLLSAINWDAGIKERFFAAGCTEQPEVDADYYRSRSTRLDPVATRNELHDIEAAITAKLGPLS